MKFILSIPTNIRKKIQEEGINDYYAAVDPAQTLPEILYNEKINHVGLLPSNSNDLLFANQLQMIMEKLKLLTLNADDKQKQQLRNNENRDTRHFSSFKFRKQFKSKSNYNWYSLR